LANVFRWLLDYNPQQPPDILQAETDS
jgi:hypothetical protein